MKEVKEPKSDWGGNWTEKKLEAFENYVNAYLTIMIAQKRKYNGWPKTIYFDGFAGSGIRSSSTSKIDNNSFTNDSANKDKESQLYKGSAERVLCLEQKFDYYYFVDNDEESITSLKNKLKEKNILTEHCKFIRDDVNNQLVELSKLMDKQKSALVLLDPFGMQINWESIEILKDKRIDLWILVPSGVIINRLLDKDGKLIFSEKLQSYFGLSEEEIRKRFYETEKVDTLFGEEESTIKANNSIAKIAELYITKMRNIFKYVTEKPLILYNTKNVPIYHFLFGSNNQTALKIANQIIEKKSK